MWRSTSCEHGWDGWYNMWRSNILWSKSRYAWECGIGIDDIMCDDITCEYLYLTSKAGMDYIKCEDLT